MSVKSFSAKLVRGSFMFCGPLSLKRGEVQEIAVGEYDDQTLRILGLAIFNGSVVSEVSPIDVISLIKDQAKRNAGLKAIGQKEEPVENQEVLEAKAIEVEIVYEDKGSEDQADQDLDRDSEEAEEGEGTDKDILDKILKSHVSQAVKAIKSAKLAEEDKEYLLEKERTGRNRIQVISALNEE